MRKSELLNKIKKTIRLADRNIVVFCYLKDFIWILHQMLENNGNEKISIELKNKYLRYRKNTSYSKQMVPVLVRAYNALIKI